MAKVSLIGACQGWGARRSGCEDGPISILNSSIPGSIVQLGHELLIPQLVKTDKSAKGLLLPLKETLPQVVDLNKRLYDLIRKTMAADFFPTIFGGDHSIAMSTWSAVVDHLKASRKFGLIWIDAHMDAHTPATCHEGRWGGYFHGQPLAGLLGEGDPDFINIGDQTPKLLPEHVCLIGIRSFEPGEKKFLENKKVRIYYIEEVQDRGLDCVLEEAIHQVNQGTMGFGLSIDMDGFDPMDAPGVGTNEINGISGSEFIQSISALCNKGCLKALEITEFNPHRDKEEKTLTLIKNILLSAFKSVDSPASS